PPLVPPFPTRRSSDLFYPRPFPILLSEALGMPALNLAVGGAGPGFYAQYPRLIEAMNRGRFVILQCMAARHAGNSRFEPDGYVRPEEHTSELQSLENL